MTTVERYKYSSAVSCLPKQWHSKFADSAECERQRAAAGDECAERGAFAARDGCADARACVWLPVLRMRQYGTGTV